MKAIPTGNLKDLVAGIEAGQAIGSGDLRLIPLARTDGRAAPLDYLLAAEAFKRKALHVTEVSEHGVVSELLAVSEGDLPILLIDGEELVGAKQNRIVNTDILLRPRAKATIPVSCVERGRWHPVSVQVDAGGTSPAAIGPVVG